MKNREESDFENWLREQTRGVREPEVSQDFLAAQRRSIYRRIGEPHRHVALRWALSVATLLLLVAGFAIQRAQKPAPAAISDEQLFSDLANMARRTEPKAIQPIHGLFEE